MIYVMELPFKNIDVSCTEMSEMKPWDVFPVLYRKGFLDVGIVCMLCFLRSSAVSSQYLHLTGFLLNWFISICFVCGHIRLLMVGVGDYKALIVL